MNILFLGTPQYAAVCLEGILQKGIPVSGVVSQPDRPQGRGQQLQATPVKQIAQQAGLPVFQPEKASSQDTISALAELKPDLMLVVAYGELLKKEFLTLPRLGCVNLHASLLPSYRGAAPVQWALINGETTTGLTTFYLDEGMDSGDIILQREIDIIPDENTHELLRRMYEPSIDLLCETVTRIEQGNEPRKPQNTDLVTFAPKIKKEDGFLDWNLDAHMIINRLRGLSPWPGILTRLIRNGKQLEMKILLAHADTAYTCPPGEIGAISKEAVWVGTGSVSIRLEEVQIAGKRKQSAGQLASGYQLHISDRFAVNPNEWE